MGKIPHTLPRSSFGARATEDILPRILKQGAWACCRACQEVAAIRAEQAPPQEEKSRRALRYCSAALVAPPAVRVALGAAGGEALSRMTFKKEAVRIFFRNVETGVYLAKASVRACLLIIP